MITFDLFDKSRKFLQAKGFGIDDKWQPGQWEKRKIGTVTVGDGGKITLYVNALPAEFWTAEIETVEGKQYILSTGSGYIATFWPTFVLFAEGMIGTRG